MEYSKYWNPIDFYGKAQENKSLNEVLTNLETQLIESFKLRLVSDVEVGIFLSGGIDSTLVTALLQKDSPKPIKTYTIGFKDKEFNEADIASDIASQIGTNHSTLYCKSDDFIDIISLLPEIYDEPFGDSSAIPTYLLSSFARKDVKVVLSGDGGDELFGGYNKYQYLKFFENLQMFIPNSVFSFFNNFYGERSKKFFKGRNVFSILKNNLLDDRYHYQYFSDDFNFLNNKKLKNQLNEEHKNLLSKDFRGNLVDSLIYDDLKSYLPNNILYKLDTCSMANSLELRSPFLNNDLVDYVLKYINCNLKVSALDKKIILKKLAKKILPKKFNINRKLGFSVPLNIWLRSGHLRNYSYDILMSSDNYTRDSINKLFISLDEGNFVGDKIFSLLVFDRWLNNYNLNLKELS